MILLFWIHLELSSLLIYLFVYLLPYVILWTGRSCLLRELWRHE